LGGKKQLDKDREEMLKRQERIKRGLPEFEDFDEFDDEKVKHKDKDGEL
jgi:hypothetical protein